MPLVINKGRIGQNDQIAPEIFCSINRDVAGCAPRTPGRPPNALSPHGITPPAADRFRHSDSDEVRSFLRNWMVPGGDRVSAFASASLVRITQAESSLVLPGRNLTPANTSRKMQLGFLERFERKSSSIPTREEQGSRSRCAMSSASCCHD